jgi:hypothetical protein
VLHDDDTLEARLRAAILAYVAAHPQAADTADGIARWWLGTAAAPAVAVTCVLDRLVQEGRLVRTQGADGAVRYSRRPARPVRVP